MKIFYFISYSAKTQLVKVQAPRLGLIAGFRSSFLHHHVRERRAVRHGDLHHVLPRGEALQAEVFEARALAAHEAALQVVKPDLGRLHVGRVLQAEPVLGWVGVVGVGADDGLGLWYAHRTIVVHEKEE